MKELLIENNLTHWECISKKSNTWWRRCDGIEYTYDSFRTWIVELKEIDLIEPLSKFYETHSNISNTKPTENSNTN
jgi:hypothetical protein